MDKGQHLQKVHYSPVRKWTDILRIQEKSTKTANITRCLQDFEKPRLFWLMNTFTRSRLTKIKVIFIIAQSASTVSKSARNHITWNLRSAYIVSLLFTQVLHLYVLYDFIVYTSKGLSVERIMFDQDHWDTLREKVCDYYSKHFLPVAAL